MTHRLCLLTERCCQQSPYYIQSRRKKGSCWRWLLLIIRHTFIFSMWVNIISNIWQTVKGKTWITAVQHSESFQVQEQNVNIFSLSLNWLLSGSWHGFPRLSQHINCHLKVTLNNYIWLLGFCEYYLSSEWYPQILHVYNEIQYWTDG